MLSDQSITPDSGVTNWIFSSSKPSWITSPDQAMQATMSPLASSVEYSLPVNFDTWPDATTSKLADVRANQIVTITQPRGEPRDLSISRR